MEYKLLRPHINKSGLIDDYRVSIVDEEIKDYNFGIFNHILTLFNIKNKELETRNKTYDEVSSTIDDLLKKHRIKTNFHYNHQTLVSCNEKDIIKFNRDLFKEYGIEINYTRLNEKIN
ncbi:hypothetical protein KY313_01240 [Candidatus Woesearchaeota archaeon]|jgi:hypothetical protein|nr:hypothetical protein [Candidatus Woesearchaeota archaeon]